MRRPLIEQYRRSYGLPATVQSLKDRIDSLELSPREGDVVQQVFSIGGGGGGGGGGSVGDIPIYDALVDSGHALVGTGNIYATLQGAITAGHTVIAFHESTDSADITIGSGDAVESIVGHSSTEATVPVNVTCDKVGVLFQALNFDGKTLRLNAQQCRVFAVLFSGSLTNGTAKLNGDITNSATSIAFNTGANGGLRTKGFGRIEDEYISWNSGGAASSGTLSLTATGRGIFFSKESAHRGSGSTFDTITDISIGHLEIAQPNCEVIASLFVGCNNENAIGILIEDDADATAITSTLFLANTLFNAVALMGGGTVNGPQFCNLTGVKFIGNSCRGPILHLWTAYTGASGSFSNGLIVNGCIFNSFAYAAVSAHVVRSNFAGNTFAAGLTAALNITNLTHINGSGTNISSSDTSIPYDTDAGTQGTRPAMGIIEIAGERIHYSRLATSTDSGTSTSAPTATTLTDTGKAWTVDQWRGQVVIRGTSWGIVQSNTATVLTIDSWRGGTPASGAYSIVATFVGCVRGFMGTTAAAIGDNVTINYRTTIGIITLAGNSAMGPQANLFTGALYSACYVPHLSMIHHKNSATAYAAATPAAIVWADNALSLWSGYIYASYNMGFSGNMFATGTIDGQGTNISLVGGGVATANTVTITNIATGSTILFPGTLAGYPRFMFTGGQPVQLGEATGDATPEVVLLTNRTGSTSVVGHVCILDTANDYSFLLTNTGGDEQVAGVVYNAVANLSTAQIAVSGIVSVLCDGTVTRGDYLETSTTNGIARSAGAAKTLTSFARALQARAGGGSSAIKALML